jgi:hypothetical protein
MQTRPFPSQKQSLWYLQKPSMMLGNLYELLFAQCMLASKKLCLEQRSTGFRCAVSISLADPFHLNKCLVLPPVFKVEFWISIYAASLFHVFSPDLKWAII